MASSSAKSGPAKSGPTPKAGSKAGQGSPRSAARLLAVQALYQLNMDKSLTVGDVIHEYKLFRLGHEVDGDEYVQADATLFQDLTEGAWSRRIEWKELIQPLLREGWSLNRLDKIISAILMAAAYEFVARIDVPTKVVINEYLDVAHAFLEKREVSFINGVMDGMAKSARQ